MFSFYKQYKGVPYKPVDEKYMKGRPKKYATIQERKIAMAKRKKEVILSMTPEERKNYYHELYIHQTRVRQSRDKHIENAIKFLQSFGYEVI